MILARWIATVVSWRYIDIYNNGMNIDDLEWVPTVSNWSQDQAVSCLGVRHA